MEVFLIRHTAPDIAKGICYGQSEVDLLPGFQEEATRIRVAIASKIAEATIYSSPLARCVRLAQFFAKNYITDERLLEMNFGDWELKKWNDLDQEALSDWMKDFVKVSCPNGESFMELYRRVESFFNYLTKTKEGPVIIVTHAGVIRAALSLLDKVPLKDTFDHKVDYGQVFEFQR